MADFLTDGRLALLAELQADATLSANVDTWYAWGPGLIQRYQIDPAHCPIASLVPAQLAEEALSNIAAEVPQDLELGFVTDGQNAEPCETLVAAALSVLRDANDNCLGLATDGLSQIRPVAIRWRALEQEDSPRVLWEAILTIRLSWLRRF